MGTVLRKRLVALMLLGAAVTLLAAACSRGSSGQVLYIGGIPDQEVSVLESRFKGMAEYLSKKTGLTVRYVPTVDYVAVVTAFKQGDVQLGWFGGLTGVQARLAAPGAQAIAQRPEDEQFHSVFIAQAGLGIKSLADLKGKTFTFGSESSTSGYLMPRYFLKQAGVVPERDLAVVNFSGSHDKTWKLVESGAFQAGVLNELVWEERVAGGTVNTSKVVAFLTTAPYYDYHWVIRGDVDKRFGKGTVEKLTQALLEIDANNGPLDQRIMRAFQSDRFVPTRNENYEALENVARELGIIR